MTMTTNKNKETTIVEGGKAGTVTTMTRAVIAGILIVMMEATAKVDDAIIRVMNTAAIDVITSIMKALAAVPTEARVETVIIAAEKPVVEHTIVVPSGMTVDTRSNNERIK